MLRQGATLRLAKVAWIRNDSPAGQPAPGRLNCPCGNAPQSRYDESAGNIVCACGAVFTWNGHVISQPKEPTK